MDDGSEPLDSLDAVITYTRKFVVIVVALASVVSSIIAAAVGAVTGASAVTRQHQLEAAYPHPVQHLYQADMSRRLGDLTEKVNRLDARVEALQRSLNNHRIGHQVPPGVRLQQDTPGVPDERRHGPTAQR